MFEARVHTGGVDAGLDALIRAGRDIGPVLHASKKPLRTDQREHQRQGRGPDGPWPGSAASTIRKRGRTRTGRKRRRRTLGRLPGVLTVQVVGRDALVARSRVAWAHVHQDGGRVGRGARIPARPFLYFGPEFLDQFEADLASHLSRAWGRKR